MAHSKLVSACLAVIVVLSFGARLSAQAFVRGEANADGTLDLSDGVAILSWLFLDGRVPPCLDAADADDSGAIDLSDAVRVFGVLFLGAPSLPEPFPDCGGDPSEDPLSCDAYPPCQLHSAEEFSESAPGDPVSVFWTAPDSGASLVVAAAIVDGNVVAEGDMVLGPEEEIIPAPVAGEGGHDVAESSAIIGQQRRWEGGVIPFAIVESDAGGTWGGSGDLMRSRIQQAIAHWEANTPIRFVPRTSEPDYVVFTAGRGCAAHVGRRGGKQSIWLQGRFLFLDGCGVGNIIHEIGHAVGLWHEQSRCDRDAWIRVECQNIDPARRHNFSRHCSAAGGCWSPTECDTLTGCSTDGLDVGPYDYASVMHYPATAFSRNGSPTITPLRPLPPGVVLGQRQSLSQGDILAVQALYPPSPPPIRRGLHFRTALSNGDGTWTSVEDFHNEVNEFSPPRVGDFNGDGRDDLVFHLFIPAVGLYIRAKLADGSGRWTSVEEFHTDGHSDGPLVGDTNGDGRDDLVFYSYRNDPALGWGWRFRTKFAPGDGTAAIGLQDFHTEVPAFDGPRIGDFDGDGRRDLVFHYFEPDVGLYLRAKHSNGNGTFSALQDIHGDGRSDGPLVGDTDGDGRDDLVFYSYRNDPELGCGWRLRTKFANGGGTWLAGVQDFHTEVPAFDGPRMGDFDRDGRQDILFHFFDPDAGLFLRAKHSNGNGTFSAHQDLHGDGRSDGPLVGDVDGDDRDDLVFYSYRNDPTLGPGWRLRTKFAVGDGSWRAGLQDFHPEEAPTDAPLIGDFNGDGRDDLVFYAYRPAATPGG